MTRAVHDVLDEIGADEVSQLLVLSKADRIAEERRRELALRHPDAVLVSALTGEGIDTLIARIEEEFARTLRDVELLIPFDEGDAARRAVRGGRRPGARGDRPTGCSSGRGSRPAWRRATSASRSARGREGHAARSARA